MFGTVRTVSNQGGAQFSDIQSAITAASPGDTIYIGGSAAYYCAPAAVKNNITFIGAGFNPQKQAAASTYVICSGWTFGSGNVLIGMHLQQINITNVGQYAGGIQNITVKRCRIDGIGSMDQSTYQFANNVLFEDCIFLNLNLFAAFNSGSTAYAFSSVIRNCLFYNSRLVSNLNGYYSGLLVDHCIFYSTSPLNIVNASVGGGISTFTNNIFVNANAPTGADQLYYNNYSTTQNLNINSGSGNLQGANPVFVSAPGGTFSFSHNYHLGAGSPCTGTGISGSDMGIYSGIAPFIWEGNAAIPQIDFFNIIGTQIPQNGSVNVQFQSTIKN